MRLAAKVSRVSEVTTTRFITGVDISVNKLQGVVTGAVVIDYQNPPGLPIWWREVVLSQRV